MTLKEKKVIVDYLRKGDEVAQILLADLVENEYPQEVQEILSGVFEAIMRVDELDSYKLNDDIEEIVDGIVCNYTLEELQNCDLMADQLRTAADENESFENSIFEIGVNAILEEIQNKHNN